MDLLWGGHAPSTTARRPGPGPRPGLTVDAVVDAAVAVADADGMPALSMRAVGERLGRTATALYTYVPGKSELVDLMYDRVLAELPAGYPKEAGWRAAVTAWADDNWEFHLRHPWVLQVSQARPVLGPNEYRAMEALIGALRGTGLPGGVLRRIVGALVGYVRGCVRTATEARQAAAATGVGDDEWWFGRASLLAEVAPDFTERFPLLAALEQDRTAAFDPDDDVPYQEREARATFTAGLAVLLDGIEAAIVRAAPPAA
ncbi:TetR/AcrR family transcriptional regulator C-terminal domain-containing protein [Kitasatospora sp. NPDC088346]|uniref:TetR/AcrR family transcriptional regulator C-terminal domain-containing protein n=1 Tax=Kitasatospora sp. NPDC088346 TaxID=3364073 RepID=UPI00382CA5B7